MDHIRQIGGCSRQLLVSESIYIIGCASKLTDIASVFDADSLGNRHNHDVFLLQKLFYPSGKLFNIERQLRQIDQVRSVAVLATRERCSSGQPACIAAHDLDDDHLFLFIGKAKSIPNDFLGGGCNVLRRTSVTRSVICQRQIVVDGFRNTYKLLGLPG